MKNVLSALITLSLVLTGCGASVSDAVRADSLQRKLDRQEEKTKRMEDEIAKLRKDKANSEEQIRKGVQEARQLKLFGEEQETTGSGVREVRASPPHPLASLMSMPAANASMGPPLSANAYACGTMGPTVGYTYGFPYDIMDTQRGVRAGSYAKTACSRRCLSILNLTSDNLAIYVNGEAVSICGQRGLDKAVAIKEDMVSLVAPGQKLKMGNMFGRVTVLAEAYTQETFLKNGERILLNDAVFPHRNSHWGYTVVVKRM
jgi:hypothetical protein